MDDISTTADDFLSTDLYAAESYWEENIQNLSFRETSSSLYVNVSTEESPIIDDGFGWSDMALVSLFCSIIAGTVAGNTLVIAAVVTTRRLRTVTNCFVMSLAVADWLVGMFVMPPKVALYLVNNEWRLGNMMCELWISLDILLCTASILSLCAISIDRYLAITRPLAYSRRRRSKRLALSMISCVWVAAVVITSPPIFGWYDSNRNVENKCDYNENTGYVVYSALGSFFLPLFVMLYVYARIACVIAQRQKTIQKLHSSSDRFDMNKCCTNDAEEPLQQNRDHELNSRMRLSAVRGNRRGTVTRRPPTTGPDVEQATTAFGGDHRQIQPSPSTSSTNNPKSATNLNQASSEKTVSFWRRLGLKSCTRRPKEKQRDKSLKGSATVAGQKNGAGGSSDSESNSATIAISIPHPSTLAGSAIEGRTVGESDGNGIPGEPSPENSLHLYHHHTSPHQFSRMRTGSRLCNHSVATTSPQRSVHRVHQTTPASGRIFTDDEIIPSCGASNATLSTRVDGPRVWTVEESSPALISSAATKSHSESPDGRLDDFPQSDGDGRVSSLSLGYDRPSGAASGTTSLSPCTSAPNIIPSCDNGSGGRLSNRIYQPHNVVVHGNHMQSGHRQPSQPSTTSRRSMKVNVHGNQDQNQNARDFMSGRVASFKRETKTARTLAAVVGGFIICWLPFFVAYVIGPFMPSRDSIPSSLMDALIWLGWGNSAINPLIYSFYSADFRSAFWRLTIHKCEALIRTNPDRSSPRRYDDNTQLRMST